MHGQRVAGEQHVDVAAANQLAEIRPAAGVDYDRAGDDRDAIAGLFGLAHHRGNSRDADLDAALGRDLVRHEREAQAIARLELRDDLDAVDPADDGVAAPDLAQLAAHGTVRSRRRSPRPCAGARRHPVPLAADERLMVRGGVEVVRSAAVAIGGTSCDVLDARDAAAEADQFRQQLRQDLLGRRRHAHRDERRLVVGAADAEFEHLEGARRAAPRCRTSPLSSCESIRWPSASTTSATGLMLRWRESGSDPFVRELAEKRGLTPFTGG